MSETTKGGAAVLAFIATMLAIAGIWFTDAATATKLASTSMLFVFWTVVVVIAGRDRD